MNDDLLYHVSVFPNIPYVPIDDPSYVGHKHQLDIYVPISPLEFSSSLSTLTSSNSSTETSTSTGTITDTHTTSCLNPQQAGSFPTIVYFHGGGWILGDRNEPKPVEVCLSLARRGFTVIAPSYRLGSFTQHKMVFAMLVPLLGSIYYLIKAFQQVHNNFLTNAERFFWSVFTFFCILYLLYLDYTSPTVSYTWPCQIEDAAKAVKYVQERFHPEHLFLSGHSAGAHLASTLAFNPQWLESEGTIRGLIAISGPYSVSSMRGNGWLGNSMISSLFGKDESQWEYCFPLHYVRSDVCPVLMLNAEYEFGLKGSAKELYNALVEHQVWVEQYSFRSMTHFSIVSDWESVNRPILNLILDFCSRVMNGEWPNL